MTNREWLGKMCLADMLNIIIKNDGRCVLSMLGQDIDAVRCSRFIKVLKNRGEPINAKDVCYDCMRNWLNEKNILKRS